MTAGVPMPLIIMFHGAVSSGRACWYAFPMADEFGYLILAPDSRSELTWDLILGSNEPGRGASPGGLSANAVPMFG